ncbi:MAG: hypothetical protein ACTSQH_05945, partial [Candidatus Hodarchaeales archaeon]
ERYLILRQGNWNQREILSYQKNTFELKIFYSRTAYFLNKLVLTFFYRINKKSLHSLGRAQKYHLKYVMSVLNKGPQSTDVVNVRLPFADII